MKSLRSIIIWLLVVFIFIPSGAAKAVEVNASYFKLIMESSEDINTPSSDGVLVTVEKIFSDVPLYPWFSFENISSFGLQGQPLPHFMLIGGGLGFSRVVVANLKFFVNAGWFEPVWELNNVTMKEGDDFWSFHDRYHLYFAKEYGDPPVFFDEYVMNVSGNFGGMFGFNYSANLTKNLSFTMGALYRLLDLSTITDAYAVNRTYNWQKYDSMKLSGYAVTLGFDFKF